MGIAIVESVVCGTTEKVRVSITRDTPRASTIQNHAMGLCA